MKRRMLIVLVAIFGVWLTADANSAVAQGLIWSLPKEEGTWVRYEGTYIQTEVRSASNDEDLTIEWIRHLTIKSLKSEMADYNGEMVACRWIEIEQITGKPSETGIDPGPTGKRVYKVLVPENRVLGTRVDEDNIHVSFLPIVKGYRRIGDGEVKPISAKALQVYPMLSLLMHYKTITSESDDPVDPEIPLQKTVTSRMFKGVYKMESPTSRSTNEGHLWRSDDVPFGLAKWTVKMDREAKDTREPRNLFQMVSRVAVEMSAHEIGNGAQSNLVIPNEPAP